jgi:hypothetical protein
VLFFYEGFTSFRLAQFSLLNLIPLFEEDMMKKGLLSLNNTKLSSEEKKVVDKQFRFSDVLAEVLLFYFL